MTNLRVGIDGTPLLGPRTGIGHYTARLCAAMLMAEPSLQLRYFYGYSWSDRMPEEMAENGKVGRPLLRAASFVVRWSVRLFGPKVAILRKQVLEHMEAAVFRKGIANFRPHVIHATNNYIHPSDIPTVVTVHDISCFRHPETHPEQRVRWQQKNLPKSLQRSAHVLAVSEFTKKELVEYFGISPGKVTVVHNGVDGCFRPRESADAMPVLNKFHLSWQGYILAVGTIEPRKNLGTLVEAFTRLPANIRAKYPIVIVGMRGWKESSFVKSLDPLVREGSVCLLGYVSQEDIPFLFNGARVFAYPSIYEGFGIPVAEAMASGIPVIASNSSSLPEVIGDAGPLIEPLDIAAWTEVLGRTLLDAQFREELRTKGIGRAKRFTWQQCAKKTLSVYERALKVN